MELDDLDISQPLPPGIYFIVTSTFGQGEPPSNAQQFATLLLGKHNKNDFAGVEFAVFGLGSSTFLNSKSAKSINVEKACTLIIANSQSISM
jgi:sulfite reductase alpha subunit-like flavoprotein